MIYDWMLDSDPPPTCRIYDQNGYELEVMRLDTDKGEALVVKHDSKGRAYMQGGSIATEWRHGVFQLEWNDPALHLDWLARRQSGILLVRG